MIEDNEIYNYILIEFQLSDSNLNQMKDIVQAFTKARMDIINLLNITNFNAETLYINEKQFNENIDINRSNIMDYEKKQIDLKEKIKINRQENKAIKLHINKLEFKLTQEKQVSRKYREVLHIFIIREKFKFIKKLLVRSYRKVFLRYTDELSIKAKIVECNERKEKIRKEKEKLHNSMEICNKKIIIDKKSLAEMRKNIINMQKSNSLISLKLQRLEDYKKIENKFSQEVQQYKK